MENIEIKKIKLSKNNYSSLLKRSDELIEKIIPDIKKLLKNIKKSGFTAVKQYTEKFNNVIINKNQFIINRKRLRDSCDRISKFDLKIIKRCASNIRTFHKAQIPKETKINNKNYKLGLKWEALDSIGVYVPGGSHSLYPSTALMGCIPAKIAGVNNVIVATPPNDNGKVSDYVKAAAYIGGADYLIKAGGAQAIGTLAYIQKVDKIIGPGSIYVTAAKQIINSEGILIDSPAGPSEVLIIADKTANPRFIALDLISQAGHGISSCSILITDSAEIINKVKNEINIISAKIKRDSSESFDIICKSLKNFGKLILCKDMNEAINFSNNFAPEHLQLMVNNPEKMLKQIKNASAVFLGNYSPTASGDYITGTNHILPTGGNAKRYPGITVFEFLKPISYQKISRTGLEEFLPYIERMSELENFYFSHGLAVKLRLKK